MPMDTGKKKRALGTGACVIIICILSLLWHGATNADIFFMYRHGKDLLAGNWDRSYDFVSAVDGLPFMHQKWAMCILVAKTIDWFGMAGINAGGVLFFMATGLLGFFISEDLWPGKRCKKLMAAAVLMCVMCNDFTFSFRPHVVAGWCLLIELWTFERYAVGRMRPAWLCAVAAACSFVTMWFHSTMWVFCFVPLMPYLCEFRFLSGIPVLHPKADPVRKMPVAAAAACMALAGCLNPAGLGQLSYMFLSAGAANADTYWYVNELQPVWYASWFIKPAVMAAWMGWTVISAVLVLKERRLRDVYLWAGSVLIMCVAMRMVFQAMLFMWFAAARHLDLESVDPDDASARGLKSWLALVAAVVLMALQCAQTQMCIGPDGSRIIGAWASTDAYHESFDEAAEFLFEDGGPEPRVFVLETDTGSYLNYLGVRCLMDTRCELYGQEDASGGSVLGAVREALLEGQWEGRPLDADGLRSFLGRYGIEYVLLRPGGGGPETVFVQAVHEACGMVWENGVYEVYRVS